jgi:hypothetical protein
VVQKMKIVDISMTPKDKDFQLYGARFEHGPNPAAQEFVADRTDLP